ncbi:hypothetical protein [Microbacterium maritypicum]
MTEEPFYAKADRYTQNVQEGRVTKAMPALLNTPFGRAERGVAMYVGPNVRFVIPISDALRIATQIADIASATTKPNTDHKDTE